MPSTASKTKLLFGGDSGWKSNEWTASDDRVRGGASQSYFSCSPGDPTAKFYGNLDIDTLGGAGFASQRTASDDLSLDLSDYEGIQLVIAGADSKKYTLILKDTLLPRSDNGRERAVVSWEYDFTVHFPHSTGHSILIRIPWADFKATYRGREKKNADPLDQSNIKRLSFMVRSFFATQKGEFSFTVASVSAYKGELEASEVLPPVEVERLAAGLNTKSSTSPFPYPYQDLPEFKPEQQPDAKEQGREAASDSAKRSTWCCGWC